MYFNKIPQYALLSRSGIGWVSFHLEVIFDAEFVETSEEADRFFKLESIRLNLDVCVTNM